MLPLALVASFLLAGAGEECNCASRWIPLLYDPDASVRQLAASALQEHGAMACDAVPYLEDRLADPSLDVRLSAAEALSEVGGDPAAIARLADELRASYLAGLPEIPPVKEAWIDTGGEARIEVAARDVDASHELLEWAHAGELRRVAETRSREDPGAALRRLGRELDSPQEAERASALRGLDTLATRWRTPAGPAGWVEERSLALVASALSDPAPDLRASAADMLADAGPRAAVHADDLKRALDSDPDRHALGSLRRAWERVRGERSENPYYLCGGGGPLYTPPALSGAAPAALVEALSDPCASNRYLALGLMRRLESGHHAELALPLVTALDDPVAEVRIAAIETLGGLDVAARVAVPELLRWLRDGDHLTRLAALQALQEIEPAAARPVLAELLEAPNPELRQRAVRALAAGEPDAATEALLGRAVHDPDLEVAALAAWTLVVEYPATASRSLAAALDAEAAVTRLAAAIVINEESLCRRPNAVDAEAAWASDELAAVCGKLRQVVAALVSSLDDEDHIEWAREVLDDLD